MIPSSAADSRPSGVDARVGFTMVELLVAIALGLIILGMVGYCFHHTQRAANRALAMLEAHHKARVVMGLIKRDLEAMHPGCAMDISANSIEFMTCVPRLNRDGESDTPSPKVLYDGEEYVYDLMWVRYTFNNATNELCRGLVEPTSASPTAPSASATQGVAGYTIIEGISGEFEAKNGAGAVVSGDNLLGVGLDGNGPSSGAVADLPHQITIKNLRIHGTDTGGFGTTVGVTFEQTITLPRAQ